MSKAKEIADIIERKHPGLLEAISQEDNLTQEELIGKVLKISYGQMVSTHQNKKSDDAQSY